MILLGILVITLIISLLRLRLHEDIDYSHLESIQEGDTILIESGNVLDKAYVVVNNVMAQYLILVVNKEGYSKSITIYYNDPELKNFKYYN